MSKQTGRPTRPYSEGWHKRAYQVATDFCPPLVPCTHCEQPVAKGYMCTWCGKDPSIPPETVDAAPEGR